MLYVQRFQFFEVGDLVYHNWVFHRAVLNRQMVDILEALESADFLQWVVIYDQSLQGVQASKFLDAFEDCLVGLLHIQKLEFLHFFYLLLVDILDVTEVIFAENELLDRLLEGLTDHEQCLPCKPCIYQDNAL